MLILNRKSAARPEIRAIVKAVQKEMSLDVWVPWSRKQTLKVLKRAVSKGTKRVIAGGGDGTLNAVANALIDCGLEREASMGLVPLGTANDFARAFGDHGEDIGASLRHAVTSEVTPLDVGRVNDRRFVNVASGGFGAMITATTPQEVKRRLGGLAYTLAGMARLSEMRPAQARVSLDGSEPQAMGISALAIGNSRYAGGGFDVAPKADVADGLLDMGILGSDTGRALSSRFADALEADDPFAAMAGGVQFKKAVLETEEDFHLNLDGEPLVARRFEIVVEPGRLNFVLPRAQSSLI